MKLWHIFGRMCVSKVILELCGFYFEGFKVVVITRGRFENFKIGNFWYGRLDTYT